MEEMGCICPLVKEQCIGKKCCEFIPRHTFTGCYFYGVQDLIKEIWYLVRRKEYVEPTYIGTVAAHCRKDMRSAHRFDKEELTEDWTKKEIRR